jgi:hypothetical protein
MSSTRGPGRCRWKRLGFAAAAVMAAWPGPAAQGQCELARLLPGGGTDADTFGASVAVSADGARIVIGAGTAFHPGAGERAGAVYVFASEAPGPAWVQEAELRAADVAADDFFGTSVAISGDGLRLMVGAPGADDEGTDDSGAVYFFTWGGAAWAQQDRLTAPAPASDDGLGESVAVSTDGTTLIATASNVGSGTGAAYVFVVDGPAWTLQATLTASDGSANDLFGSSAALSADGNTALVGASSGDSVHGTSTGSAYVFVRNGETWTEQDKLIASDGESGDAFGSAVALASDGDTALVGAPSDSGALLLAGSAYVFDRSAETWAEHAKITAFDAGASDGFGDDVALSADGETALIGARADTDAGQDSGSVSVLVRDGGTWSHRYMATASDAAPNKRFGTAIARAADAEVVVIGAEGSASVPEAGSAYVLLVGDADCNENGVTDGCDVAPTEHTYLTDDGGAETWRGAAEGGGMIWFNRFNVYPGAQRISSVYVAWGDVPDGTLAQIAIWTDPDDDGDPSNGEIVVLTPPLPVTDAGTGNFTTWLVTPTIVGGIGEVFYVGAYVLHDVGETPAALDESEPQGRSWMALGSQLQFLANNDALGPVETFGFSGNWMIRAGDDPDAWSNDVNGNALPDECELIGDLDGDGMVGVLDFLILLSEWGPCPEPCPPFCAADLDNDCNVGVLDFLTLLTNWSS